ncbi:thioesterase II family protein [Bacillus thuringiensis]|uniref:thioesterase II family protein n=1 Tax=Bacillus thuringiensis TaxID=1428 RepID=UPI000BF41BCA|nr:thioesterase domain-containing protein [Bacillus thuringiensis]PFJ51518.1 putative thioesterase [Bacillus thuringiensis]PFR39104.1 putative thioesterase [Bacillus thuringiensis]PGL28067.1 putative thioesterase [Bacillus thuringiensis]
MKKIKLFCIPYAGGSATIYSKWAKNLSEYVELCELELPGRGRRFNESFYRSIDDAAIDLCEKIKELSEGCRYAILGHSMGSLIAFEVYYKLVELGYPIPLHIFFSGCRAPHITSIKRRLSDLPLHELREEILEYGATPTLIFDHEELLKLFIPIFISDFRMIEDYVYFEKEEKIKSDITIMGGINDGNVSLADLKAWEVHAFKSANMLSFNGGHFFINEDIDEVTSLINKTLCENIQKQ